MSVLAPQNQRELAGSVVPCATCGKWIRRLVVSGHGLLPDCTVYVETDTSTADDVLFNPAKHIPHECNPARKIKGLVRQETQEAPSQSMQEAISTACKALIRKRIQSYMTKMIGETTEATHMTDEEAARMVYEAVAEEIKAVMHK